MTTPAADTIATLAQRLRDARRMRTPLRQFSREHPGMTGDDGYAARREPVRLATVGGRRVRGRKIGLAPRAMQPARQITEPDFAPLVDDMPCAACGDIPFERFIAPRIEQLDRETRQPRRVTDTVSDRAASAGSVLGGRPVRPTEVDLRWVGALLPRNGLVEETGLATGMLNHPGNGVAWLADKIAARHGHLNPGDVVPAGLFKRPVAAAGDTFHADCGPPGSVAFRLS